MLPRRHPETGVAGRRARESLFALLVGAVLLGLAVDGLVQHLWDMRTGDRGWWISLGLLGASIPLLAFISIRWDDRRVGQAETSVELLLPYTLSREGRVHLGQRRSYPVTTQARAAWASMFPQGLELTGTKAAFVQRILPEHMDLVRYLLTIYSARFGQLSRPKEVVHDWLRIELPLEKVPWGSLPPPLREVPFAEAAREARPQSLWLPKGTMLEAFDQGPLLVQLRWRPTSWRWVYRLLGPRRWLPGGEVQVRWLGPLSEVPRRDKRYEHMTARLGDRPSGVEAHVVVTRLVVTTQTRWNILEEVARFRDWSLNLGLHWQRQMDYWTWRAYHLERVVDDLEWKIGWMRKGETSSIVDRLEAMEKRLADLEARGALGSTPADGRC